MTDRPTLLEVGYGAAPVDQRNELYTTVIRALTALMTFEMGDESAGIRRFTRAQKLAQLAHEISASYATRVSDVVSLERVGGHDVEDADVMMRTVANADLHRPLGAPYEDPARPGTYVDAQPLPGLRLNDRLPPPAMQTAIATMRELMLPLLATMAPPRAKPRPAAAERSMRLDDLTQARAASIEIGQPTVDLDRQIMALVVEITNATDDEDPPAGAQQ